MDEAIYTYEQFKLDEAYNFYMGNVAKVEIDM